MNAIEKALLEVKYNIPSEILKLTFIEQAYRPNLITSLDEKIMNMVIRPRVLVDTDLIGGVIIHVDIEKCGMQLFDRGEMILTVPKTLTQGRAIVSAQSISCNNTYLNIDMYNSSVSNAVNAAMKMNNNIDNFNVIQSARLSIIGENVIQVEDLGILVFNGRLKCTIGNDPNMTNLKAPHIRAFAEICILAVKSYIYNEMRVKINKGYLSGGQELSTIQEIVESYSDAEEMYNEKLDTKFKKILFISNSGEYSKTIRSRIGNII